VSEARLTTEDFEFFTLRNVSVPEPGGCALAAIGLSIGLCGFRRSPITVFAKKAES
jgi:hypothetical protein